MLLLLLSFWIIAGIGAEDPPTMHYKEKNSSLCFKVGKSSPDDVTMWRFNKGILVLNGKVNLNYTDKVDYDPRNHALCIKNLTATDSGIYTFSISAFESGYSTKTHRLIVEETVPRPVIRMSVLHSNLSAGLCRIMVNCSVQGDLVSSVCEPDGCEKSHRSLFRNVNITIFTKNGSVVCSGSNHISTSNVSEHIEAICFRKPNPEREELSEPPTLIIVIGVICVFIIILIIICAVKCLHSTFQYDPHQAETSTAQIIQSQPVEAQPQPVPRVSTSSSSQAEACYENVDATQPCSPPMSPREDLASQQSQKVDTIYHVLQVPNVTSSQGESGCSKDTKGCDKTSQSVTLNEAEHPAQVHTLYGVLQKPTNLK